MHSVIHYAEDGQVLSVARLPSEAAVEGKLTAMAKAGQSAAVLWFAEPSIDIKLLVWDAEQGRLTKRAETLAELRAPLIATLKQMSAAAMHADHVLASGAIVQGDARAQQVVMSFALRIRAGEQNPHGGIWRLRDNSEIAFGEADVLELDAAFTARNSECQRRQWDIAAAIRAYDTAAALKAFDLAAAWDAALAVNAPAGDA